MFHQVSSNLNSLILTGFDLSSVSSFGQDHAWSGRVGSGRVGLVREG